MAKNISDDTVAIAAASLAAGVLSSRNSTVYADTQTVAGLYASMVAVVLKEFDEDVKGTSSIETFESNV